MKITQSQLRRLIREEKEKVMDEIDLDNPSGANGDHHWPRVEWDNVYELVDKWADMETKAFNTGDPSMNPEDMSQSEAKEFWLAQVEAATIELEAELTQEIRKAALRSMKSLSDRLLNGDFA
tara:strand:- start:391 stop:756 length:366 start_codon:yes stop_codon:yes gene_type:complete